MCWVKITKTREQGKGKKIVPSWGTGCQVAQGFWEAGKVWRILLYLRREFGWGRSNMSLELRIEVNSSTITQVFYRVQNFELIVNRSK